MNIFSHMHMKGRPNCSCLMFYSHMQTKFPFNSIARRDLKVFSVIQFFPSSATKWRPHKNGPTSTHAYTHTHTHTILTHTHTHTYARLTQWTTQTLLNFYSTNCWYARANKSSRPEPNDTRGASCLVFVVSCSLCACIQRSAFSSVSVCVRVCV